MATGPGKYGDLATLVRERSGAQAAVVIVVNGERGSGFSVQVTAGNQLALVRLMRTLADGLEQELGPDLGRDHE